MWPDRALPQRLPAVHGAHGKLLTVETGRRQYCGNWLGRAMVSGKIADVGQFKPPILRGLAARSPYFHAGTAQNIQMLIHFYNARFQIGLTEDEVNDLGAFLEAQ